jgi:hypothetical protein
VPSVHCDINTPANAEDDKITSENAKLILILFIIMTPLIYVLIVVFYMIQNLCRSSQLQMGCLLIQTGYVTFRIFCIYCVLRYPKSLLMTSGLHITVKYLSVVEAQWINTLLDLTASYKDFAFLAHHPLTAI